MAQAKVIPICTETHRKLESIRKDYKENLERIRPDLKDYHEAAFDKFVFQFHSTLSKVLEIESNLTLDELIDQVKALSSRIYLLNKNIKEKEDELLKLKDKKVFALVRKEIKDLNKEKEYFAAIERNVSKNNLVMTLQEIAAGINRMGFSGEKTQKEDAAYVMTKTDQCMEKLTEVDCEQLTGMDYVKQRIKKHLDRISKEKKKAKPKKKEEHKAISLPLKLNQDEKDYIKSKVGEDYYNRYALIIIGIIEGLKDNFSLGAVADSLKKQGWPPEYVKPSMDAVKEVLQKRL